MADCGNTYLHDLLMQARKQSPLSRIASRIPSLRGKSRTIAQFLIQDVARMAAMTIEEIAAECGTSRATITRASNELGYRNFSHLRADLLGIADDNDSANGIPTEGDHYVVKETVAQVPSDLAYTTMADCITMLLDTFSTVSMQRIHQAAQMLVDHQPISLYGGALSGGMARVIQNHLRSIGLTAYASSDVEAISNELRRGHGLLFCVSHLAGMPNVFRVLSDARRYHVPSILLTNLDDAPACSEADLVLTTNVTSLPTDGYDLLARTSGLYLMELLSREVSLIRQGADSATPVEQVPTKSTTDLVRTLVTSETEE